MNCNKNSKLGFSLPELMVLLLALSIMLAAAAPVVSRRKPSATATALPRGAIIVWCNPNAIPNGYKICDSANHSAYNEIPDLTGRFVIGANNNASSLYKFRDPVTDPVLATEQLGACSSLTDCTHAFSSTEIPAHYHPDPSNVLANLYLPSVALTHTHSVTVGDAGAHTHVVTNTAAATSHYHSLPSYFYGSTGSTFIGYLLTSTANSIIAPLNCYSAKVFSAGITSNSAQHAHAGVNTSPYAHSHGGTVTSSASIPSTHSHSITVSDSGVPNATYNHSPYSFNFLHQYRNCYYIMRNLDASWGDE